MEAVILAGGLGTRLRPVLPHLPKAMAPIGGRPFLGLLLDQLEAGGFHRVVLAVGWGRGTIIDRFGSRHGALALDYACEEQPLGTGGALREALRRTTAEEVFVRNGDTFVELDHRAMLAAHREGRPAGTRLTLAVRQVDDAARYGRVVVAGGRILGFEPGSAPGRGLVNAGTFVLDRRLLEELPPKGPFSFEKDFLRTRIGEIDAVSFPVSRRFIDIGVPADYRRAQSELAGLGTPP